MLHQMVDGSVCPKAKRRESRSRLISTISFLASVADQRGEGVCLITSPISCLANKLDPRLGWSSDLGSGRQSDPWKPELQADLFGSISHMISTSQPAESTPCVLVCRISQLPGPILDA